MSDDRACRLVGSISALVLIFITAPCLAGNGAVIHLPATGVKMKNGLQMDIDTRGSDASGYRPFKIKITNSPAVASTYDRQVRVTLEMQGWGAFGRLKVSQVLEIPEGSTSAEEIIAVPNDGRWNYFSLEVREGGQKLEDLSAQYLMINAFGNSGGDETFPSLLFIGANVPSRAARDKLIASNAAQIPDNAPTHDLPDLRNVVSATHDGNTNISPAYGAIPDRSLIALLETSSRVEMLPPDELPERWIDWSSYSIVFISRSDLKQIAKDFPERKTALQDWLSGGAVLVVTDSGDDYEHLAEIEKLLELPPRPDAQKKGTKYRGWQPARLGDQGKRPKTYGSSSPNYARMYGPAGMIAPTATIVEEVTAAASPGPNPQRANGTPPFVSRPAQWGWLFAIPEANPYPGRVDEWEWLLASIPDQRESWSYRHGMTLIGHNDGFWNWHIPGVGAAPVFSFMLLGTLFAIVIGPLNYLLLGRIQRLSMLLLTVPAGALLVTLCLFLYALLTDGLGVRSRVRSYTMLDQRSGQMASWSRQTYFASIAPSRGLKFPEDATVFPLEQRPEDVAYQSRALDWEPDGQRLKAGFISSRSLEQFMVLRCGKSERKLVVAQAAGGKPPSVHNNLGTRIKLVMLRDSRGNYYSGSALEDQSGNELVPLPPEDARKRLTQLIRQQEPKYPEGYDPTLSGNAFTRFFGSSWSPGSGYSPVSTHVSLLELNLSKVTSATGDLLEPGTYLAVVDACQDVPMGVANTRQQESLHLIQGRW